jgi:cephalosporin-C deacetylase
VSGRRGDNDGVQPPFRTWFPDAEFDATYGYDVTALQVVVAPAEPPGFVDFWTGLRAQANEVATAPELRLAGRATHAWTGSV